MVHAPPTPQTKHPRARNPVGRRRSEASAGQTRCPSAHWAATKQPWLARIDGPLIIIATQLADPALVLLDRVDHLVWRQRSLYDPSCAITVRLDASIAHAEDDTAEELGELLAGDGDDTQRLV